MKAIKFAITGIVALGVIGPANADTFLYDGSDTLNTVTNTLIDSGNCGDLVYLEGGSSAGEKAMCGVDADDALSGNPWQVTAPMSRALSSGRVCDQAKCPNFVEGEAFNRAIGLDGLAVARNSARYDGCGDLGANWDTTLRTIYGGVDGSGSPAACGAQARRDLLANYSAIYDNADCGTENCAELSYAFRRGNNSGTTGVFKSLTGVDNFCNVPDHTNEDDREANDNGDNDPVRRCCSAGSTGLGPFDRYCPGNDDFDPYTMPDGSVCERTIGVVLPIDVPSAGQFGDDAALAAAANNNTNCQNGKFGFALPAGRPGLVCPTGGSKIGGLCRFPLDGDNNFGCNNNKNNRPAGVNLSWDARAYNMVPRLPDGTQVFAGENSREEFWRLAVDCEFASSTNQIGCLAGAHRCSMGWAGREMVSTNNTTTQAVTIEGLSPMNNEDVAAANGYPLARKLYFNSLNSFSSTQPDEAALIACYNDAQLVANAMTVAGFIPLDPNDGFVDEPVSCQ